MQINRLFEIVYLLLSKERTTASELAEHFEVAKRTILRDIDILSQAGIPIYTVQGKGGGLSILENFTLNKTAISEDEQKQILLALQSISVTSEINVDDLLAKLESLFQKSSETWIDVDFSRWGKKTANDNEKFEKLRQAIIKSQEIEIDYMDVSGKKTTRTIYPLKLIYKEKSWYLYGYCLNKNDYRLFKIKRIKHIFMNDHYFDRSIYSAPPIENPDITYISMILKINATSIHRAYDDFEEQDIVSNLDGSFIVNAEMPDDNSLYGYLLSYGADLEVLEPLTLRLRLAAGIQKITQKYEEDYNA
ncbi:putative DNA-binding transcriptional regulator YafY [Kineothrix alysoides]|uniref:Putative DNA-binding transcriptional regulator YafY n=1 Tax=Kineothrix alysoides TaxID=1469948 RepID=A0A4R1QNP9_9FIRM|nr:YafY family protein [Kineothrix alysoides]TCL54593.1 putative DNA-binding transcriptional regulator YafY [Kineothrix alysoides]